MSLTDLEQKRIISEIIIKELKEFNEDIALQAIVNNLIALEEGNAFCDSNTIHQQLREPLLKLLLNKTSYSKKYNVIEAVLFTLARYWPLNVLKESIIEGAAPFYICPITRNKLTSENSILTHSGWQFDNKLLLQFLAENAENPETEITFSKREKVHFITEAENRNIIASDARDAGIGWGALVGLISTVVGFAAVVGTPAAVYASIVAQPATGITLLIGQLFLPVVMMMVGVMIGVGIATLINNIRKRPAHLELITSNEKNSEINSLNETIKVASNQQAHIHQAVTSSGKINRALMANPPAMNPYTIASCIPQQEAVYNVQENNALPTPSAPLLEIDPTGEHEIEGQIELNHQYRNFASV